MSKPLKLKVPSKSAHADNVSINATKLKVTVSNTSHTGQAAIIFESNVIKIFTAFIITEEALEGTALCANLKFSPLAT